MDDPKQFFQNLRRLIAKDQIRNVIDQLEQLLANSPDLKKVLLQSARHTEITRKIDLGVISDEQADLKKNQIRLSLLNLIEELENPTERPEIREEVEKAVSMINNKNMLVDSTIHAGGNVVIGDHIQNESETSRKLKILLYVIVPLLAITGSYFWYQTQVLQKPFSYKVKLHNLSPSPHLPEPEGVLTWIDDESSLRKETIHQEAIFEGRNPRYRKKAIRFQFEAEGFEKIDTSFIPENDFVLLPVKRNDEFAQIKGNVYLSGSESEKGIEGVLISTACCSTLTDGSGNFTMTIPSEYQREFQMITLAKEGYQSKNIREPVSKGLSIKVYMKEE